MHAAATPSHRAGRSSAILLFALGALLMGCAPKAGVQAPLPKRGDPVRVTTGDYTEVYEFREMRGDVLVVESKSGENLLSIPLASVDELEAVVGHRSRAQNGIAGAGGGLLFGAGFGVLMGLVSSASCQGLLCDPGFSAAIGAAGLGALGASLGLIFGTAGSTRVWAPVDSSALEVQAHASPGAVGLQLSWRP